MVNHWHRKKGPAQKISQGIEGLQGKYSACSNFCQIEYPVASQSQVVTCNECTGLKFEFIDEPTKTYKMFITILRLKNNFLKILL